MVRIVLLHPQCARLGGAIKMVLLTAKVLREQGHEVTLYTFEKSDTCFPELQIGINIQIWKPLTNKRNPLRKLINIITLTWHVRHVDIIIANNPPMQIVAVIAKIFSL